MSEEKQNNTTSENNPFDKFTEHQRKAFEEATKAIDALLPAEFKEHGRAALEEFVEGFRVLFNVTLDEVKKEINNYVKTEGESGSADAGGRKIKVDLN